jgi:hypothetical protein
MTQTNHKKIPPEQTNDPSDDQLDRRLDAALAKYAAVEPRPGLEERVLANLRAEQTTAPARTWWRWGMAGALAAIIAITSALAWRSGRPSHPVIANHPGVTMQAPPNVVTQVGSESVGPPRAPERAPRDVTHRAQPEATGAAYPKLDQFPSPQPMSEQEKLLTSYIARSRDQAVLVARARTEELQRDQQEKLRELGAANDKDSQPQ